MTSTLTHVAAAVAGMAVLATTLILPGTSRGLRNGLIVAVALGVTAALLISVVRQFG